MPATSTAKFPAPAIIPQSPIELKIKACSLAAEARIIRKLEKRQKRPVFENGGVRTKADERTGKVTLVRKLTEKSAPTFWKLRNHRTIDVRQEARATHLARAFLKGMEYKRVESTAWTMPNFAKIEAMITKYGIGDKRLIAQRFAEWKDTATKWQAGLT